MKDRTLDECYNFYKSYCIYYEEYRRYKELVDYDVKNKEARKRMEHYKKASEMQIICNARIMNSEDIQKEVKKFNEEWSEEE